MVLTPAAAGGEQSELGRPKPPAHDAPIDTHIRSRLEEYMTPQKSGKRKDQMPLPSPRDSSKVLGGGTVSTVIQPNRQMKNLVYAEGTRKYVCILSNKTRTTGVSPIQNWPVHATMSVSTKHEKKQILKDFEKKMQSHAAYKTVNDTTKRERLAQWATDMDCQSEDGDLNEQHRAVYLASVGILLVEVEGSIVPMTMTDYLIENEWNIDTLMAVISSRQLPADFKYDEYIDNSTCTVDILAFEETKSTNEDMELDDEENKRKRLRGNSKDGDSQKKMSMSDLSDSDKEDNTAVSQLAKKSKPDPSAAPPKTDSKPPPLSKSKVLWEPPKFVVEIDVRVKNEKNDHATSDSIMLQDYAPIDANTIRNKEQGRLEVARQHQIILKVVDDCKKFQAENEKITGKYNKAKVHIIEFDSIVNDFIAIQGKVTAAMAEKEQEIEKASKEVIAVKAELKQMKQSNKEKLKTCRSRRI